MTTIGADLTYLRLAHRVRRIEQVLIALRTRRREQALEGAVPPMLDRAITDFSRQLTQLRADLQTTTSDNGVAGSRPAALQRGEKGG